MELISFISLLGYEIKQLKSEWHKVKGVIDDWDCSITNRNNRLGVEDRDREEMREVLKGLQKEQLRYYKLYHDMCNRRGGSFKDLYEYSIGNYRDVQDYVYGR